MLRILAGEGETEAGLRSRFDGSAPVSEWLQQLAAQGWLCYTAVADGRRLATYVPASADSSFNPAPELGCRPHVLSRFLVWRREGSDMVLESPLAASKVLLHDAAAIVVAGSFVKPVRAAEPVSPETQMVLTILANSGAIVPCDDAGREQEPAGSDQWEFHDLFFHTRSRAGRHANHYGRRFSPPLRFEPQEDPPDGIALYAPDRDALQAADPPFARVVESRRSIRPAARNAPVSVRQLGEFLYRAAAVRAGGHRPYPAAGGCYELELYLGVRECAGLDCGLHHYNARTHRLRRLSGLTPEVTSLLEEARLAAGSSAPPQILIVYAARMDRLTTRYQSIAYALALKDAGALQQTMCLTATAMGLAGCALGGGNSDVFTKASGQNYYRETSIGEFLLGGLPVTDGL